MKGFVSLHKAEGCKTYHTNLNEVYCYINKSVCRIVDGKLALAATNVILSVFSRNGEQFLSDNIYDRLLVASLSNLQQKR